MTIAIYALSGDPITYGHIDIINRASHAFEKLIVGLGVNSKKKYLLTPDERETVAKQCLAHLPNVEVRFFEGLLVDFAYEQGVSVIVRGIRNPTDAVEEQSLDQVNGSQMSMETMFMFSRSKLAHVSSSNVKALQAENGLIVEYVPLPVKKKLEKKISNQLVYGITGVMGSGKSFIAEQLAQYSQEQNAIASANPLVYNIELDSLAHLVYTSDKPAYKKIRDKIEERFGTLDRKEIGRLAFSGENSFENVAFLNDIFKDPLKVLLRQELRQKEGIILVNAALLVEGGMLNLCNNHVIMVSATDEVRFARLKKGRNIEKQVAEDRVKHMKTNDEKVKSIQAEIKKENFGKLVTFDNSTENRENLIELYNQLTIEFTI